MPGGQSQNGRTPMRLFRTNVRKWYMSFKPDRVGLSDDQHAVQSEFALAEDDGKFMHKFFKYRSIFLLKPTKWQFNV